MTVRSDPATTVPGPAGTRAPALEMAGQAARDELPERDRCGGRFRLSLPPEVRR